jgi:ATP adenylyltransferase
MTRDQLWAGWRSSYIESIDDAAPRPAEGCVFCRILASDLPGEKTYVVARDQHAAVLLNAYPYGSGHALVMPTRHVGALGELSADERTALWDHVHKTVDAITKAYDAPGLNVGANLGRAAGAGIPEHLHVHALPRWGGDTNFMTSIAETRVLPEPLDVTWRKLTEAWPTG